MSLPLSARLAHRPLCSHLSALFFALSLLTLCLTLPARAQMPGQWWPRWTRCDAAGNPLAIPAGIPAPGGGQPLLGTLTGHATLTGTYQDMLLYSVTPDPSAPSWTQPYPNSWWAQSALYPNPFYAPDAWLYPGLIPNAPDSKPYAESSSGDPQLGARIALSNKAGSNGSSYGFFSHDATGGVAAVPSPGVPIIGTVNSKVSVPLALFLKWDPYYSSHDGGYGDTVSPPGGPPKPAAPDHLNLLLTTSLTADASVDYGASGLTSGLTASASATDGMPFGETASASAGDGEVPGGVKSVVGHHLVRAVVSGGIATVFLNRATEASGGDQVPAGTMVSEWGHTSYKDVAGRTGVSASTTITADAKQDDREVEISSAIETSYFKSPDGYSGSPIQVQHYRNPDGSISVDSIVFPVNDPWTGQHFIAGHTYYSNASSFTFPKFAWSVTGDDTPDSMTTANFGRTPDHPNGFTDLPATLDFGTTWDLTQTKASQIQVNVTDSDGVIGVNTYNVTWHAPAENFKVITLQRDVPKLVGALQDVKLNASLPKNLTIPDQKGQIDWGDVQHKSGLAVAVTGSAAGGLLLIPDFKSCTVQWQAGWYTDIADSLGDGYDINGYVGSVPAHAEIPKLLFKRFVWTCTYKPVLQ